MNDTKTSQPPRFDKVLKVQAQFEIARGSFSNVVSLRHTKREFIFDFLLQIDEEAHLVSRIILTPEHAKALKKVLEENIKKFEEKWGPAKS